MDAFGVCFLLAAAIFIGVKIYRSTEKNNNIKRANYLHKNYPNGFRERFGYVSSISQYSDRSDLSKWASASEYELQRIEERINAERARELREEAERIREEKERKERELNSKYAALKRKYPNGIRIFEKIIADRSNIREYLVGKETHLEYYEKTFKEYVFFTTWEKELDEFSKTCRNLYDTALPYWTFREYFINIPGKTETGSDTSYKFTYQHLIRERFCQDKSLDYSEYKSVFENLDGVEGLKNCNLGIREDIYDSIFEFVKQLPAKPLIVFGDSGMRNDAEEFNDYHFEYLRQHFQSEGIDYVDFDYKVGIIGAAQQNYVIIDVISSWERVKLTCKIILDTCKDKKPCVTFITVLYELSSAQMSAIIENRKKLQREIIEQERKLKEKAEIRERERIVRESQEEERRRKAEEERKRKEDERRLFKQRVANATRDWPVIAGLRLYFFYWYYPKRYSSVSADSENARSIIYSFKDGTRHNSVKALVINKLRNTFSQQDLGDFTFVCIPASTIDVNNRRYSAYSSEVCSELNMWNGFEHITITKEKTASHLGGTDSAEYSFDSSFFNASKVVLFDDVVTRGSSMSQFKSAIESLGGEVVCAITIGRTFSNWNGHQPEPHPYTGRI